jgi:rubrerythrin
MTPVFIDKLCERLAVEQAGVRIYETVLAKLSDPAVTKILQKFQRDEARHRDLLAAYLERSDVPESMRDTPSARVAKLEGESYLRLIDEVDAPQHLLNILLTVELTDENAWELLINLARDHAESELVETFAECLANEKTHLRQIRGMVAEMSRAEINAQV